MKTKALLMMAFAMAIVSSCQSSFNYKIEGKTKELPQVTQLFLVSDMENGIPFDTITINNGQFSYENTADSVTFCFIGNLEDSVPMLPLFLEEGVINVVMAKDHTQAIVKGTPLNDELQKLNETGFKIQEEISQLLDSFENQSDEKKKLLEEKSKEGLKKLTDLFYKTAEKNIDNELGFFLVSYPTLLNEEQELILINKMPTKMRQRERIKEIEHYLKEINNEPANNMSKDEGPIPNFSAPDLNGKMVSAMDVISKNKLTLIDFWASWCRPCMQEMPHMVQLYQLYHNHGLGILGVSLDNDEAAWKEAVKQTGAIWTHICERKQNSDIARMFGINAIPFTMIVDNEGNVLASGLTGTDLEDFLRENLSE